MIWPPVAVAVLAFASGNEAALGNAGFSVLLGFLALFWLVDVVRRVER